jgi:hypothetical protein
MDCSTDEDSRKRIRFVKAIGLWAFSRGQATCRWRTPWCKANCYNNKWYKLNKDLLAVDAKDDAYWRQTRAKQLAAAIPEGIDRFRFSIRGEIWLNYRDVMKVRKILELRPEILFWIPTRAWITQSMMEHIDELIRVLPNARVMASTDPTTSDHTEGALGRLGWSTVFAGNNDDAGQYRLIGDAKPADYLVRGKTEGKVRCPKTWQHKTGHCAVCTTGCFSDERVDVHLMQHR